MNVLSLFDGISCGRIALEKAGISVNKYFASEINEKSISVTQSNYPDTVQLGDVTKVDKSVISDLPKIDLLLSGFPCKNLSQAMKNRDGIYGEHSKLFFEFVRIWKEIKPKYFFVENVASMSKEDKEIITELIGVEPIRINSKLVSAQLRNRYYWTNIPNLTQPEDRSIHLNDVLDHGWTDRDKARCLLESDSRPLTTPVKMFHRYYSTGFTTLIFKDEEHYIACKEHYDTYFKGFSAKDIDSFEGDLSVYNGLRYLNQAELERLQTVPRGYTKVLNRNEAAGVLGDGWTVDVIAHIFSNINNT